MFGAEAQAAPHSLQSWWRTGIRHFRVEFVHQSANQVEGIGDSLKQFFNGQLDATGLARQLELYSDQGITEGSLFVPKGFKQLVQLS